MRELNTMQQKAADTTQGHILVLAGAGTGKTTVLTERALNLIRTGKARPYQMLCITFTNKAAREMRDRIAAQAGDIPVADMWTCTFHSMCGRILRMYPPAGFTSSFSIYDADDALSIVKELLKNNRYHKKFSPAEVRSVISRYKNSTHVIPQEKRADAGRNGYTSLAELDDVSRRLTCGEYAREEFGKYTKGDAEYINKIYAAYQKRLETENAMDFDDLLLNALRTLREDERARTSLQNRFRYVMVDEYQDTNPVQYRLVRILSAGHGNLFCVGDDDQSIYSFRGADVGIIRRFEQDFPDAVVIRLEQNYRSTNAILGASNAVIRRNADRFGKELWSENGKGDKPVLVQAADERAEAQAICRDILARHEKTGEPFAANAVLYRMHSISRAIEEQMIQSGIPYRVYGGVSFYNRKEIKDILAYLSIIANPQADQQLLRILNVPARRIGAGSVEKLRKAASENGMSLLEVMRRADELLEDAALKRKAGAFIRMYDEIADGALTNPVHETIDKVVLGTGYEAMLRAQGTDEASDRLENIGELISAAAAYDEENGADFTGFMENVALLTDQDTSDTEADAVSLMTVHAAKGLEFDNVYVAGLAEEIFPSARAMWDNDAIEEERRLCYVALTRAKKRLILLTTAERYVFGEYRYYNPSRFLDEIPKKSLKLQRA